MSDGRTKYPTFGVCIYCGRSAVELSDEHILPYSLFGVHVIEKASCRECAKVTGKFEQDVSRGLWRDFRTSYGAPTRRKSDRRIDHFPGGASLKDYPAPGVFYLMSRAAALSGLPEDIDFSEMWRLVTISDHESNVAYEKRFGRPIESSFKHVPYSYGRMLAKIGYGQVLTGFGIDEFEPICVPYILGEKKNISYIVGGSADMRPPEPVAYRMSTCAFGGAEKLLLVADIRLWAHLGAPNYHVVVGAVTGRDRVRGVLERMRTGGAKTQERNPEGGFDIVKEWLPGVWPVTLD